MKPGLERYGFLKMGTNIFFYNEAAHCHYCVQLYKFMQNIHMESHTEVFGVS